MRWPYAIDCPGYGSNKIVKRGRNYRHRACRRYTCRNCAKRFNALTETLFMGRHQPLSVGFSFLYLMGLNESDGRWMAGQLRKGIVKRRCRLKGAPGRGTLGKDKPPIFGMIEGGEAVRIVMLADIKQRRIRPLIEETIEPGTLINTDEYVIEDALPVWGYQRKSVCHSRSEYARDENGDGFYEVYVNTTEGF